MSFHRAGILSSRLVARQLRQLQRGLKTQSNFAGLRATAAWDHSGGFGYDTEGELVLVTSVTEGSSNKSLAATEDKPNAIPVLDADVWSERLTSPQGLHTSSSRGNAPWARPNHFQRRFCGSAAAFSTLSGDGCSSGPGTAIPLSLIIFDKDGTLIDVNAVWLKWMESYVVELEEQTGLKLADKLYKAVGYCRTNKEYHDDGLLAHATIADITDKFKEVLIEAGVDKQRAHEIVDACCQDFDTGHRDMLEPLGNLTKIFQTLKTKGIKTAVCTADSRSGTMSALQRLGLTGMIDKVVCGDDYNSTPKPAPDNALHICKVLNVPPSQAAIIGDTTADTGMGRSAGLGMTIGVLSGAGSKQGLEKDADVILSNVDEVLGIVLPDDK